MRALSLEKRLEDQLAQGAAAITQLREAIARHAASGGDPAERDLLERQLAERAEVDTRRRKKFVDQQDIVRVARLQQQTLATQIEKTRAELEQLTRGARALQERAVQLEAMIAASPQAAAPEGASTHGAPGAPVAMEANAIAATS